MSRGTPVLSSEPEGVATAAIYRGTRGDKWQRLEQVQAKDFLGRALHSCHAAI